MLLELSDISLTEKLFNNNSPYSKLCVSILL